ncbi:hypothetical protein J2754_001574 [Halarchaeum solikamskense]|uniref:hypothetical protein n=1 Tax=Halarchaeum nitratireducens TaxID=489913 RepID=UPI001B3B0370|nr:hypothetical protein [Halarchaeum solikamskense]MBP2251253.1 hypothetical protein [Halarchaeum solikamskense]
MTANIELETPDWNDKIITELADDFDLEPEEWRSMVNDVYAAIIRSVDLPDHIRDDDCTVTLYADVTVVQTQDLWDSYVDFAPNEIYEEWEIDGYAPEVYGYVRLTICEVARSRLDSQHVDDETESAFLIASPGSDPR